jgi:hypothetical protein
MIRPSGGTGWVKMYPDLEFWKSELFFILGLDITSVNQK